MSSNNFETYLIQQHLLHPTDATEIASVLLNHNNISDLAKLSLEQFYTLTSSIIKGKITQYVTWLACKEYNQNNELTTITTSTIITSKKSHFAPYTNITSPFCVIDLGKINFTNFIKDLEFSRNGKFLYVTVRNTIEIWSIPDCQLQCSIAPTEFGPDNCRIWRVSASPRSDALAFILGEGFLDAIVIWNVNTHSMIKKLQKNYQISCVQYNANGSALGFSGHAGVGIHDVTKNDFPLLFVLDIGASEICFVPTMKREAREYFVYVTQKDVVCVNLEGSFTKTAISPTPPPHSNQQLWSYPLHYDEEECEEAKIAFSLPHGLVFVSPGYFTLLNVENGQVIKEINDLNIQPRSVSVYESFMVIGGPDGFIEVRNIPEMTLVNKWYHSKLNNGVVSVGFHPSGNWIVSSGSSNNQIKLWSE
jgi:WD40 repeat protein